MARLLLPLLALLALALAAPLSPAHAASRNQILRDCQDDDRLQGTYTLGELRDARNNIPDDTDEYGNCRDILLRAMLSRSTGGGGGTSGAGAGAPAGAPGGSAAAPGGGGTGSPGAGAASGGAAAPGNGTTSVVPVAPLTPSDPADTRALQEARRGGGGPVTLDGAKVRPGGAGLAADVPRHDLPSTVIAVLVLLALTALTALAPLVRRRVRVRRQR